MVYLVCFGFSVLMAYFANRAKDRRAFIFLSALSIIVPVLLAGLRDYSIGIDVKNYLSMERFWAGAIRAESLGDYLAFYLDKGYREPLFALFIGAIAQFTGEYRAFLLLAHLVIVSGVYIGACRLKKYARPEMTLLLFYLLYFNNSLNIIRQYMAMALVFAFCADLLDKKYIRYLVVVLIASLVHTTALLSLVPLVYHIILYTRRDLRPAPWLRKTVLYALLVVGIVSFIPLVNFAMDIGLLGTKYAFYFKTEFTRMSYTRLGLHALECVAIVLCYKKLKKTHDNYDFLLLVTATFMAFHQLAPMIQYGQRIAIYFAFLNIVLLSTLPQVLSGAKLRLFGKSLALQPVLYAAIIAFSAYYWYYQYVLGNSSETVPYLFGL